MKEHCQDDSHALFNNAALREGTPICLGYLFVLHLLQTTEPGNLLLQFIVSVNRVIGARERERERGGMLKGIKTVTTGGVSSLVSPLD